MKKRITFTIDQELIDQLKKMSVESGIPQSRIVTDGIELRIKELEELLNK